MEKVIANIETDLGTLLVKKGINDAQIGELVDFAKNDPLVIKFTRDKKRFATYARTKN